MKIIHTSSHVYGQIYIPEVNWLLMLLCLAVTIGFRDIDMIGNAYGMCFFTVHFDYNKTEWIGVIWAYDIYFLFQALP